MPAEEMPTKADLSKPLEAPAKIVGRIDGKDIYKKVE